ncbi:MAG: anaerobic ribonucleoside-triphosphate reductase activating protein [Puniceicoccales bacterium]
MLLAGLQRCSLVDFPGQTCCTIFTQGCNLCCPYCHNGDLISARCRNAVDEIECWDLLLRRKGKVGAVTVTGGEPTQHVDLPEFWATIKSLGFLVKLDTNGTRPGVIRKLLRENLVDCIALDVKAPLDRYDEAAGRIVPTRLMRESIAILKHSGIPVEFRTTVVPAIHTAEDIGEIARELVGGQAYYLQAFDPKNALSPQLRETAPPSPDFMKSCCARAGEWIETFVR